MYSSKFRQLRPLACASPAQTAQPLLPELRPHPPPKRTTEGIAKMCAAGTPRLRPHPPPKRTTEGIAAVREFFCKTNIYAKEKTMISSGPESFKLPPIFGPSQARGLCPYPPAQGKRTPLVAYGISAVQFEADLYRQQSRSRFIELDKKEALCPQVQHLSEKKRASSKIELKAKNDWADFKPNLKPCLEAPKAVKAPDANRIQLKREEEPEALERKVSEPMVEREEMDLTEPEEPEEGERNPEEMDRVLMDLEETIMWEYKNSVDEMFENDKVIKCRQDKIEKMKEKADRIREESVRIRTLIQQKQEGLIQLQGSLGKKPNHDCISKIMKMSEKLAEVYEECFGFFGCSDFLSMMLLDFNEWSFDCLESMPAKTLHKKQKQFWKDYDDNIRLQKQMKLEALKDEQRQRRREIALERALAPRVKISGRKLMPRSPPPKKVIKKEEPVENGNLE